MIVSVRVVITQTSITTLYPSEELQAVSLRNTSSFWKELASLITQTKRRYKKIVKRKVKTSEDLDNIDSSCTDDESEDGRSTVSHNDQDSDVSFESDNDEEIDAAEIEEEDWTTTGSTAKVGPSRPWRTKKCHLLGPSTFFTITFS